MPEWWELNLKHLRAVAATSALGSVSAAAQNINLSQPALTQGLAKVERLLGTQLFQRRYDGMTPTDTGALVAHRIRAAEQRLFDGLAAAGRARPSISMIATSQVRAFLAFAKAGSFSGASTASGLAEPILHRSIAELQRSIGLDLYVRIGRAVRLTDAGKALAQGFGRAAAEIQAAISDVAHLLGRETGTIRIGALPLSRARLVPAAVARFHACHPTVQIEIIDGTYSDLAARLKTGEADVLVGALRGGKAEPAFREEPLFDDLLSIAARQGHPLMGCEEPGIADLARFPWIIGRGDTPHAHHWRAMFRAAGLAPPSNPIVCGSVMAIRELLEQGDYLALLSSDQVQRPVDAGHLVLLGKPVAATRRTIGLTFMNGFRPTALQADLLDVIRSLAAARSSQNTMAGE